jgi:hypothetical protein
MKRMNKKQREEEALKIVSKMRKEAMTIGIDPLDIQRFSELKGYTCPICGNEIFRTKNDYSALTFEDETFYTCSLKCSEELEKRLNSPSHRFGDKDYYPHQE